MAKFIIRAVTIGRLAEPLAEQLKKNGAEVLKDFWSNAAPPRARYANASHASIYAYTPVNPDDLAIFLRCVAAERPTLALICTDRISYDGAGPDCYRETMHIAEGEGYWAEGGSKYTYLLRDATGFPLRGKYSIGNALTQLRRHIANNPDQCNSKDMQ